MFNLTQNERERMGAGGVLVVLERAVVEEGANTMVWSDGSGVWSTSIDDVEHDGHEMATLGELVAEYRELVAEYREKYRKAVRAGG